MYDKFVKNFFKTKELQKCLVNITLKYQPALAQTVLLKTVVTSKR